ALVGPRHAALWTAAAVFCSMLWPYAYIGLETTQSLFLLLTGYLALGPCRLRDSVRIPLLGLCAGLALVAKAGGVMLAPGIGFAMLVSCCRLPASRTVRAMWLAVASVLTGAVLTATTHWRVLELGRGVGGAFSVDPLFWLMNLLGLLLSLNKGLVVYAPLVLLALVGLRHAWRRQPQLTVFAVLNFAGLAGGLAL